MGNLVFYYLVIEAMEMSVEKLWNENQEGNLLNYYNFRGGQRTQNLCPSVKLSWNMSVFSVCLDELG